MGNARSSPRARLLALLEPRGQGSLSALGAKKGPRRDALDELAAEGVVLERGGYAFLADRAALARRIESRLLGAPKLFRKQDLKDGRVAHPAFEATLEDLWAARRILRFEVKGQADLGFVFLHVQHAGRPAPPARETDSEAIILAAHRRLAERSGDLSVRVAELVAECGLPLAEVQAWIRRRVMAEGWGALESGDWPSATAAERAAAVTHHGTPRLYVRILPPQAPA